MKEYQEICEKSPEIPMPVELTEHTGYQPAS